MGTKLKVHPETFKNHGSVAVSLLIGQFLRFMQTWRPEELELTLDITESDSKKERKQKVLRQYKRAARVVCALSVNRVIISVQREWFTNCVGDELKFVHDFYNAEIVEYGADR